MNKIQIVAISYEKYLHLKNLQNKNKHEKVTKKTKHSNLVRLICQR
jgi:hypothetical protein